MISFSTDCTSNLKQFKGTFCCPLIADFQCLLFFLIITSPAGLALHYSCIVKRFTLSF